MVGQTPARLDSLTQSEGDGQGIKWRFEAKGHTLLLHPCFLISPKRGLFLTPSSPISSLPTLPGVSQTYENKQANQKVLLGSSTRVSQSSLNCQSREDRLSLKAGSFGQPTRVNEEVWWRGRLCYLKVFPVKLPVWLFYSCFYSWQGQRVILWLRLISHLLFSFTPTLYFFWCPINTRRHTKEGMCKWTHIVIKLLRTIKLPGCSCKN